MRPVVRIALAGGAPLAFLSIPLLAASGSALDAQSTPTSSLTEVVDTAPPSTIDLTAMDPNGVLERARLGLDEYLGGFQGIEENLLLSECPLQAVDDLITAVASIGRDSITADIRATIQVADPQPGTDGTSPAAQQVVPIGVVCDTDDADEIRPSGMTGGVYGVGVAAFDYSLAPDIDLSEIAVQFPDIVEPSAETFGFTGYRGCLGGSDAAGTTQCYSWWKRDRFVIGMYVTVDRETVDQSVASVQEVAQPLAAEILQRLAERRLLADDATPKTAATD